MIKTRSPFSSQIEAWLKSDQPKTFNSVQEVFGEKGLAILVLLLMFLPALPLPTGGIVHGFEIITMLIAVQMILGIEELWLPKRWRRKQLGDRTIKNAIPFMIRRIRWLERFSRPRMVGLTRNSNFGRLTGLVILIFTIAAFSAPPFSGLDTLPALGAVLVALSIILEDIIVFIIGVLVGIFGIGLSLTLGAAVVTLIKQLF